MMSRDVASMLWHIQAHMELATDSGTHEGTVVHKWMCTQALKGSIKAVTSWSWWPCSSCSRKLRSTAATPVLLAFLTKKLTNGLACTGSPVQPQKMVYQVARRWESLRARESCSGPTHGSRQPRSCPKVLMLHDRAAGL